MKRVIPVCLIAALVMCAGTALAGEAEKVEVVGQAAILDGDKASARDKAIDDGLRKAVESAVGTMISAETVTENYQLITDRILSKAEGYVQKYKITDEREEDGVIIVEITATVSVGAVTKDMDGLKTLLRRANKPKVLLLIAEQNIGMNGPAYWWGKHGPVSMELRSAENALMEAMMAKGFTFVDTEVLSGKKTVRTPVVRLSDKQAKRIADLSDCQIVIVGQAVAKDMGKTMPDANNRMVTSHAEFSARAIKTDTGKIFATASASARDIYVDAKFAGTRALKKAGKKMAEKLMEQIGKQLVTETSGTKEIRMTVKGLRNFAHLRGFMKVLSNKVRSVKDVRKDKFSRGSAVLEIDLAGDTSDLATELEAKDFGGEFKLEITEVTNNAIGVKLLQ